MFYIRICYARIVHCGEIHLRGNDRNARCRSDIDAAALILCDRSDLDSVDAIIFSPEFEFSPLHQCKTALVSSDPKSVLTVYKQADNAAEPVVRSYSLECVAVISYKAAVASDPDKTVACLSDRVGFGSRKAVCVVVQYG